MINRKNRNEEPVVKMIPLGGLHEIGKNTFVFECGDEIMLVDAGLAFPTDSMHGVNIVLPDVTYLRENRHRIQGMVVTHGHEDHIGGIPYHLKQFDIPVIYGPRLAIALLTGKLEEAGVLKKTELRSVRPRDRVQVGTHFTVEFIRNTHSISDSFTLAITTPVGVIIFTGDYKIDHTPVDGERFDLHRLAEYGERGIHCLISDSTNSEVPGFTPSERSVYPNLDRIFAQTPGRLLVTTFASSVHRVNMILQLAQKHERVVVVVGRSMLNVIDRARNLGYIKCEDNLFQPLHVTKKLPDKNVLILTTGSQGEPLAALTRIAQGEHRQIKIQEGDTVVFSANPIPGNTIAVVRTIDKLMMQGAQVIYGRDRGIHVSGHGCQEDQKLMLALTKPKYFMPVHGEYRMLMKHAETARSMGVEPDNIAIAHNGDIVALTEGSIGLAGKVTSGIELMDSSRSGTVQDAVLKQRQQLAEEGIVTVAAAVTEQGKLAAKPEVHLAGVVSSVNGDRLSQWCTDALEAALRDRWSEFTNPLKNGKVEVDWNGLKSQLEQALVLLCRRKLQSNPMLVFILQTPQSDRVEPVVGSSPIQPRRSAARVAP